MVRAPYLLFPALVVLLASACGGDAYPFDPENPARGPGELVGNNGPLTTAAFTGGDDAEPATANVSPPIDGLLPDCDEACRNHCTALGLNNPVNRGLCESLWGVGLTHRPVQRPEACRRLWIDVLGRFPTRQESEAECVNKGTWGEVVTALLNSDEFVLANQRRWADRFLYNNTAISIERIWDMDALVGKLYRGAIAYDQFAAVASAHPVLTRRFDTSGDRAEALFTMFLGRPPYENERSDMARLYEVWGNGYYDHPVLQQRLPDAVIDFPCTNDDGKRDAEGAGACTSVLWGYNELILEADIRAVRDGNSYQMWSGLIRPEEWAKLQLPGKIISSTENFWERLVDEVSEQYLGYDLGTYVPAVRGELVKHVLANEGDIRAVHHAVLTSLAYLQSTVGGEESPYRWTYGPLKQVDVEPWIDTIKERTGYDLATCDHRLSDPGEMMGNDTIAGLALVQSSRWTLDEGGNIRNDYRNLAQTLGGCPNNEIGGRFKTVSILTTATQEGFVMAVCNPTLSPGQGASIGRLLPGGIQNNTALTEDVGENIVRHQVELFYGRSASAVEVAEARANTQQCAPKPCTAEQFARPVCYALLSSAEMLFY